jgi:L-arabinose transport system ATP-binding protein
MRDAMAEQLRRYGFEGLVSPLQEGRSLSPAQTHIVEIVAALKPGVRVVAFDEPTSSLTADEVERLFQLIRQLRAEGLGIIYVSHRLKEVLAISDRVVVLKDGRVTGNLPTARTSEDELVRLMVGRELVHDFRREETTRDEVVLEVQGLSSRWHRDMSFSIRAGEILGFGGLVGAGRTELAKVIFGEFPARRHHPRRGAERDIRSPPTPSPRHRLRAPRTERPRADPRALGDRERLHGGDARSPAGACCSDPQMSTRVPGDPRARGQDPLARAGGGQALGRQPAEGGAVALARRGPRSSSSTSHAAVDVGGQGRDYRLIRPPRADGMAIMLISSEMPELLRCRTGSW